jgi:hypothetical protein
MRNSTIAILALAALAASALAAQPAASAPFCPGHPQPRQVPAALRGAVAQAFAIPEEAARHAVVRCVGPKLLACSIGANLNCGKADARRSLPGAIAYCRANPNSDFIPMFATGHATIYDWRCRGGHAIPGRRVATVDAQGYMAENWKEIR